MEPGDTSALFSTISTAATLFPTSTTTPTTTTLLPTTSSATATTTKFVQEKLINDDYSFPWLYVAPFILLFGSIGNILIICVMRRKRMKNSTTSVYMIGLGIFDTLALISRNLPEFFVHLEVGSFSNINKWTCRFEKFLFYWFSDVAIWLIVLFTVDRFIAVCLPLYKRKVCLPKRAFCLIVLTVVLLAGKNFHVFWTRGPLYKTVNVTTSTQLTSATPITQPKDENNVYNVSSFVAMVTPDDTSNQSYIQKLVLETNCARTAVKFEKEIRPKIALVTISIIPFAVIFVCNIAIIVTLMRMRKKMQIHKRQYQAQTNSILFSKIADMSIRIASVKEPKNPDNKNIQISTDSSYQNSSNGPKQSASKSINESGQTTQSTDSGHSGTSSSSLMGRNSVSSTLNNHLPPPSNSTGLTQTTLMCLSTSIAFLICVYPSIILATARFKLESNPETVGPYKKARSFFYQISMLNHAINFFLYCLTGQRFRRELAKMFSEWYEVVSCRVCKTRRKKMTLAAMRAQRSSSATFSNKLVRLAEVEEETDGMNYSSSLPNGDIRVTEK